MIRPKFFSLFLGVCISVASFAQWEVLNTPSNELISAIIEFNDQVYIGTNDGVYILQGNDWVYSGLNNQRVKGFAIIENNLYAASYNEGVYRLASEEWFDFSSGITAGNVNAVHNYNDELLLAATTQGVYASDNLGATWDTASWGLSGQASCVNSLGNTLIAGTSAGNVYISTNSAQSWSQSVSGLTNVKAIAVTSTRVHLATAQGLYVSEDTCQTWNADNSGIASATGVNSVIAIGSGTEFVYALTADAIYFKQPEFANWNEGWVNNVQNLSIMFDNQNLYLGSNAGMWISNDDGVSWMSNSFGLSKPDPLHLTTIADTSYLFTRSGTFKSIGNDRWASHTISGLGTNVVLCSHQAGENHIIGADDGLFISTDTLKTCAAAAGGPSQLVSSIHRKGDILFIASNNGVYASDDNGLTLENKSLFMSDRAIRNMAVLQDKIYALTFDNTVYVSDNDGDDWTTIPITDLYEWAESLVDIAATDTNLIVMLHSGQSGYRLVVSNAAVDAWYTPYDNWYTNDFAVGEEAKLHEYQGGVISIGEFVDTLRVNLAHDGGMEFTRFERGLSSTGGSPDKLSVSQSGEQVILYTETGHIYTRSVPFDVPERPSNLRATLDSDNIIYNWDDNTDDETGFGLLVPHYYLWHITDANVTSYSQPYDDRWEESLVAFTINDGDYSRLSDTVVRDFASSIEQCQLITEDNIALYPNPVATQLVIEHSLNQPIQKVAIYNTTGLKVYEQNVFSNEQRLSINTSELHSGMYFISIQSEGQVITKQIEKIRQ